MTNVDRRMADEMQAIADEAGKYRQPGRDTRALTGSEGYAALFLIERLCRFLASEITEEE